MQAISNKSWSELVMKSLPSVFLIALLIRVPKCVSKLWETSYLPCSFALFVCLFIVNRVYQSDLPLNLATASSRAKALYVQTKWARLTGDPARSFMQILAPLLSQADPHFYRPSFVRRPRRKWLCLGFVAIGGIYECFFESLYCPFNQATLKVHLVRMTPGVTWKSI